MYLDSFYSNPIPQTAIGKKHEMLHQTYQFEAWPTVFPAFLITIPGNLIQRSMKYMDPRAIQYLCISFVSN